MREIGQNANLHDYWSKSSASFLWIYVSMRSRDVFPIVVACSSRYFDRCTCFGHVRAGVVILLPV